MNQINLGTGPIKNPEAIQSIRKLLHDKIRDLLLFDLTIETGIGLTKLLRLKVKDLLELKPGDELPLEASETGKYAIEVTETVYRTFLRYVAEINPNPDDYVFKSNKGDKALNLSSASNMVKGWFKAVGLDNRYSAVSLRKTWAHEQRCSKAAVSPDGDLISSGLFQTIEIETAQETIYKKLSEAIVSCKIPPGTRVTTAQISKAFNVSQAPARVALNWLEAKGLIHSKKKKASIVKELSDHELKEIIQIRFILETAALEMALPKIKSKTIQQVAEIVRKMIRATSFEEHDKLNTQFHLTLYRDAQMPLLLQMISDLCDRISPYMILFNSYYDYKNSKGASDDIYHKRLLGAIRKKDLNAARKHLQADLNKATAVIEELLHKREGERSQPPGQPFNLSNQAWL